MTLQKRHNAKRASNRRFGSLLPNKAVSLFAALTLACSLCPTQGLAEALQSESGAQEHVVLEIGGAEDSTDAAASAGEAILATEEVTVDGALLEETDEGAAANAEAVIDESAPAQQEDTRFAALSLAPEETKTSEAPAENETVLSTSSSETIVLVEEPLDLIQNGRYAALDITDNPSHYSTTLTTAQTNQMKALLNTNLMNVVKSGTVTISGYARDACLLDLSSLGLTVTCDKQSEAASVAKSLVESVVNDNPDLFYVSGSAYSYGYGVVNNKYRLTKVYAIYEFSTSTIPTMKTKYESAMQDLLSWVPVGTHERARGSAAKNSTVKQADQVKAIHDWLVRNCKYNTTVNAWLNQGKIGYDTYYATYKNGSPWTAYGALVGAVNASGGIVSAKSPVCEGYSLAFIAACKRIGITATFVTNASHGWNRVYLSDDKAWFNLDITWDDPLTDKAFNHVPNTTYFLKCDTHMKAIDATHAKWTPAGTAGSNHTYESWNRGTYDAAITRGTVNSLTISPSPVTIDLKSTQQLTLTVKANGNVLAGQAKWSSSNSKIAAVDSTGRVTTTSTPGTATITVTLGGKTATCTVTVKAVTSISSAAITVPTSPQLTYVSSKAQYPSITVKAGTKVLTEGTDYKVVWPADSINPGTKTATINGMGDYNGSKAFTYTIYGNLSTSGTGVSVKAAKTSVDYNGTAQKVGATITFSGSLSKTLTLVEGTDYTLSYANNTNAGTATVTVTGKGAWKGTRTYTYTINAFKINTATVDYESAKRYTGSAVTQSLTVKSGSNVIPATQYTVSYRNNVNAGTATATITGQNNCTGSKVISYKILTNASWTRLKGATALDTMQSITQDAFPKSDVVIIATSGGFADALAASALAGKYNAPILMTAKASLSSQTRAEIKRMGAKKAFICGGRGAVSETTEAQIKAMGLTVTRYKGATATDTAREIAKGVGTASDTVIIATSKGYQDALSISPYAYSTSSPIILTESTGTLSSTNVSYIKSSGFKKAIIVGGRGAVKESTETQLKNAGITTANITRLKGATAYETSVAIAKWEVGSGGMRANGLGVATGRGYADALAGAALCGQNHSVLLLADKTNSSNAKGFIASRKTSIATAYVFGGRGAVSAEVMNSLQAASK